MAVDLDDWRDRVRVKALIARLQQHALSADGAVMDMSQIKAAEVLLRKVIPDMKAVEHTGLELPPRLVIDMRAASEVRVIEGTSEEHPQERHQSPVQPAVAPPPPPDPPAAHQGPGGAFLPMRRRTR
jgi:hypothetical protein